MIYSIPIDKLILKPHSYVSTCSYDVGDWLNFFELSGACFAFVIEDKKEIDNKYEYKLK